MSKYKRFILPTLTVLMLTSQLTGCSTTNAAETMNMLKANETIEINIPEPENIEEGKEISYNWIELAYLDSYESLRTLFEDKFSIRLAEDGKYGVCYIDLENNQTNNSCLHYAFMNENFYDYFNFNEIMKPLIEEVKTVYADIDNDVEAQAAVLNAYFNLLPDSEPNYFNGESTLTRGDFLSLLYRVNNPVQELKSSDSFINLVGQSENALYAEQVVEHSYLDIESKSLNDKTFDGTITVAEAIYSLVSYYYPDELNSIEITKDTKTYSDIINGKNLSEKLGFITYDKKSKTYNKVDYWKSYEISYCLNNPDDGISEDLYKALTVAYNHNLINSEESNYNCGLTKAEAINLFINLYNDKGESKQFLTTSKEGAFKPIALDKIVQEEEAVTEQSTELDINGGEGSSAIVLEKQPTTEPESTVENSISDLPEIPNYSAEFYSQDNTGKYVFTEKFYTMVLNHPYFAGATVEEVSDYYNENDFYLVDLQFGELDAFNVCLNNAYDREGQPYLDEVVQSTHSTSTETQSQTQTGQNTAPSQSTTNNSTENTTEEEPEYIEFSFDTDAGDGGNLVGNTVLH